jgi:hypothetical protein
MLQQLRHQEGNRNKRSCQYGWARKIDQVDDIVLLTIWFNYESNSYPSLIMVRSGVPNGLSNLASGSVELFCSAGLHENGFAGEVQPRKPPDHSACLDSRTLSR